MTSAANPYFAKAAANRMWHYFFGIGLVDPVDFMGTADNPPSHPELLDELAFQLAAHQFDLKYLIRAITGSQAYQRTSARATDAPDGQDDPRLFARMAQRGQSPEQLFDSLLEATGQLAGMSDSTNPLLGRNSLRTEFHTKFHNTVDKRIATQATTLQALYLMNNRFIDDAMQRKGASLDAIMHANDGVPMTRRIEELYLISLSRKPRAEEAARLLEYVKSAGPRDQHKALADIFWALLNSPEFQLNH
jgi:hypothetical protein